MRAFGCLVEELAERLDFDEPEAPQSRELRRQLDALAAECMAPDVAARPCFVEVVRACDALVA